nr:RDD family protein [Streptomyces sp. NBC_00857]
MSNDQPPPGGPPDDDPFLKRPQGPPSSGGPPQEPPHEPPREPPNEPPREPPHEPPPGPPPGSPYGSPYGGDHPPPSAPPYDPNAYGGGPYGGDPLAGMPPLAPFGKRFAARVIDALIIFIPLAVISVFVGGGWGDGSNGGGWNDFSSEVNTGRQWFWSLISCVAYVGYDTLMTKKYGQTLGKRWLRLRVAMLNDGTVPDTGSSLLRALVLWLPALICCFCVWWLVIIVTILASRPYRQGLHDKAARTVVVTAEEERQEGL